MAASIQAGEKLAQQALQFRLATAARTGGAVLHAVTFVRNGLDVEAVVVFEVCNTSWNGPVRGVRAQAREAAARAEGPDFAHVHYLDHALD